MLLTIKRQYNDRVKYIVSKVLIASRWTPKSDES